MKNSILFAIFVVFISFESAKTFTVHCDYEMATLLVVGNVYICYTTDDIPLSSGNTVTGVTGKHLNDKIYDDVEFITIEGNWNLTFFPRGFSKFFPNIKAFHINRSNIDTLHGNELNEYPKLEYFGFFQNNLRTVSSTLFEKTPKMVVISFFSNSLERAGHNLFTPLNVSQLDTVSFIFNHCISNAAFNGNQTAINIVINELRQNCPFDDE